MSDETETTDTTGASTAPAAAPKAKAKGKGKDATVKMFDGAYAKWLKGTRVSELVKSLKCDRGKLGHELRKRAGGRDGFNALRAKGVAGGAPVVERKPKTSAKKAVASKGTSPKATRQAKAAAKAAAAAASETATAADKLAAEVDARLNA